VRKSLGPFFAEGTAMDLQNAQFEEIVKVRLNGRITDFQLVVQSQGLILRGKARSYYAKQLAQHTVMKMTSMPILANEIQVTIVQPDHESSR
jgi:hypothetical protein